MTDLVEIVCSISREESTLVTVNTFCVETGGLLIGRCVDEKTHMVLLIINLPHTANVSTNPVVLSEAMQQKVIESFRYVPGDLVQISFDPPVNLREQMQNFPLRPGESWFPALQDPHKAYIRMSGSVMLAKQAAWLLTHEVVWAFV